MTTIARTLQRYGIASVDVRWERSERERVSSAISTCKSCNGSPDPGIGMDRSWHRYIEGICSKRVWRKINPSSWQNHFAAGGREILLAHKRNGFPSISVGCRFLHAPFWGHKLIKPPPLHAFSCSPIQWDVRWSLIVG